MLNERDRSLIAGMRFERALMDLRTKTFLERWEMALTTLAEGMSPQATWEALSVMLAPLASRLPPPKSATNA